LVDDFGLFRDAVEAINFHNDAGYIPNKKGAVVKRRARWGNRSRASPPEGWESLAILFFPMRRIE
jgi:hypothetical protein